HALRSRPLSPGRSAIAGAGVPDARERRHSHDRRGASRRFRFGTAARRGDATAGVGRAYGNPGGNGDRGGLAMAREGKANIPTPDAVEGLEGDSRYPVSLQGDEPSDPDAPDQNDITAAVKAHNDAEIAKQKAAIEEPNPKDAP